MIATKDQLSDLGRIVLNEAAATHDWHAPAIARTSKPPRMSLAVATSILKDAKALGVETGSKREEPNDGRCR
jgi:hypothetical protein